MSWTDERIDLLQKLWLQGMSASQIARELANGLTRNAVIGKVYRLGLSGRVKEASAEAGAPQPRTSTRRARRRGRRRNARTGASPKRRDLHPRQYRAGGPARPLRSARATRARAPQRRRRPDVEPVTIMELRDSMCRWPIGDPTQADFRFCGARKTPGEGPYCACHAAIAYQPEQDRRRHRPQKSV